MENKDFKQFLQDKKQESEKQDWEKQKTDWLKSIEKLYDEIKKWLKPFENEGLVSYKEKAEQIAEDYIGYYDAKRLEILIGNNIIKLIPKGTLVLGSYGKIDMEGTKGGVFIIKPELDSDKWEFVNQAFPREKQPVNENTFKDVIQQIV